MLIGYMGVSKADGSQARAPEYDELSRQRRAGKQGADQDVGIDD